MVAKCKKNYECHLEFSSQLQKQISLPDKEYLNYHRCERINMLAKCKNISDNQVFRLSGGNLCNSIIPDLQNLWICGLQNFGIL